eukprot:gene17206-biopygen14808
MYDRPVYKSNLRSLYDFSIYKITPPPSYYPRQSGRGVGTIIKRAAPVMKRILKVIVPKVGKAAKRVALPVIKEHREKALKRIAAGENAKKVTKETAKSSLCGIKRKAADEVVNVMNKDVLNDAKKQATEELVNTMKGIFVPNKAIKKEKTAALNASKQTVVFDIAVQSEHMIDLNHSYFISTLSIKKADGTDIGKTMGDFVGVINNIGQSLWKQIELVLNDTPVTEANGMYAYQSYLETFLTYDETRAKNYLKMTNWVSDTSGKESAGYPTTASTKNPGLNERSAPFDISATVKVITKPHVNICNQLKYLLPGDRLQWRLSPNSNAFCLMSKNGVAVNLHIKEVKLVLRNIHIKDSILQGIERTLMKSPAMYPVYQPHMVTYLIPSSTTSWVQDNVFNGKIPNRLFFGIVDNSAYNGMPEQNPFNFEHNNVSAIQVTVDNQEITPPLRLNFDDDDYLDAYNRLVSTLNNSPSLVDYATFKQGSTIYGFDLTPKEIVKMRNIN